MSTTGGLVTGLAFPTNAHALLTCTLTGLMPSISQDKGNQNSGNCLFHHVWHSIYGPLCVHPPARDHPHRLDRFKGKASRKGRTKWLRI
ncbi:hypothetical protein CC2G_014404 [Coprinopsis cinerea AmutBmut pab1-1]|nr:hypothetical protein CC2G_014404 [Coprinopsis cinerea AmutBmut pab1-1]